MSKQPQIPRRPMIARSCLFSSIAHDRSGRRNKFLKWFSVAAVLLTGGHPLHAQGADDALFIDEKGNLTIGTTTFIYQSGKVGIGTLEPKSSLSVAGGVAVGSSYAKSNPAPANDLLVEGKVGIGTKNPETKLDIDTGEINVKASHNDLKPDIGTFLANNKSQGIGIGYNSIQAIGTNADQDINIKPKGNGKVTIDRSFLIQKEITTGQRDKSIWTYPLSPGCDDHDGCRIRMWLEPTKHGANAFRIITMDVAVSSGGSGGLGRGGLFNPPRTFEFHQDFRHAQNDATGYIPRRAWSGDSGTRLSFSNTIRKNQGEPSCSPIHIIRQNHFATLQNIYSGGSRS